MNLQPYKDYTAHWQHISGKDFVTFDGFNYKVDENCTSPNTSGVYRCTIVSTQGTTIGSPFNVTFNQNGICSACVCNTYQYRVSNKTIDVDACIQSQKQLPRLDVQRKCTSPYTQQDWEDYDSYTIGTPTIAGHSHFIEFSSDYNYYSVTANNCTHDSLTEYFSLPFLDENNNSVTSCSIEFIQAALCPQCPCTKYSYDVTVNNVTVDACGGSGNLRHLISVQRGCVTPPKGSKPFIEYNIISIEHKSGDEIVNFNGNSYSVSANCSNIDKEEKIEIRLFDTNASQEFGRPYEITFTQSGICDSCQCEVYEYKVSDKTINISACAQEILQPIDLVIQRRCTTPQEEDWKTYNTYNIGTPTSSGAEFVTLSDDYKYYSVSPNCSDSALTAIYNMPILDEHNEPIRISGNIASCNVTFMQEAQCEDCQCENYVYNGIGSFDNVTIEPCGSSGTLSGMVIYRRCTDPMVTDFVIYNDWKVSGETDEFVTFNGKEWSAGQNCGEPREKTYELLILDENDADTGIRTSVKFTQDSGCTECPCEYEYRIASCFNTPIIIDACVETNQEPLEGLVVQRRCKNTENWEDYEDYIIGTPSKIGGDPFLTFTKDNKAYNAHENCFSRSIGAVYSFPILNDVNEHISACTITFIQQPCSCEDLAQKHTTVLKCTFEDSGGTNVLIGSATTHCGSISATSDSEMIDNLITQKDGDDYKFYVSVNERQDTTKPRSAGITFSYRNSDNEVSGCSTPLYIEQNGSYCECSKLPKIEAEDRYYLKWRDNEPQWFNTESMILSQDVYKSISACTSIFLTDDDPTIIDSTLQAKYSWKFLVQARWKDNISWSARTKTITAFTVSDAVIDERNVLIGGDVCDEKEITIVQSGAPTCDCESYFYICGPNALTYTDNSFTTNEFNGTVWYRHSCYEYYVDTDGEFFKFDIDTNETDSWLKLEFDGEIAFTTSFNPYHVGKIKYYFLDATSSTRTTTFKLLFDSPNGVCETEIFVTQEPKEITVCDCSSVKTYSKSLGGKSYNTFDAVEFYPIGTNCTLGGMSVNFVGDCDWINSLRIVPNGDRYKLYLDGVEQNPSTRETRQCKVSWQTDGIGSVGVCNGEIEINQKPFIECACNKLTVVDDTIETARTFDYSDQDQTRVIGSIGFDYESDYGDCGIPMFKTNNTQQRYFEIVEPINLIDDGNGHVRGEIAVTVHPYHEIGHQDVSFNIFLNGCDQSNRRWNKIIPLIINPKP